VVAAFVEKAWVCVSLPWVQSDGVEQATGDNLRQQNLIQLLASFAIVANGII